MYLQLYLSSHHDGRRISEQQPPARASHLLGSAKAFPFQECRNPFLSRGPATCYLLVLLPAGTQDVPCAMTRRPQGFNPEQRIFSNAAKVAYVILNPSSSCYHIDFLLFHLSQRGFAHSPESISSTTFTFVKSAQSLQV